MLLSLGMFQSATSPPHCFTSTSRVSLHSLVVSAFLPSLMSNVKNNIGRGLNIALVNGELGWKHGQGPFTAREGTGHRGWWPGRVSGFLDSQV